MLITCDESTRYRIKVVGSISIPFEDFLSYEDYLNRERLRLRVFGEIKWDKVGNKGKYYDFYVSAIKKLFANQKARFHSNSYKGDKYRASYALVRSISWKLKNMGYKDKIAVLFDYDGDKGRKETELSKQILTTDKTVKHRVEFCTQIDSKIFNILQITDLLTGCIAYKKNKDEIESKGQKNSDKIDFISMIEKEIDNGEDCTAITVGLWQYNCSKKLQHYNLL